MGKMSKKVILVADASKANRSVLTDVLGEEYGILETETGAQTIEKLGKYASEISLVLLDAAMPDAHGANLLTALRQRGVAENVPVLVTVEEGDYESIERAFSLGAADYIPRPFHVSVVRRRVKNTLALSEERIEMLQLKFKALHDSLTELYNHDYARERITNRLCEASADKKFALIILDLDFFKSANDNYVHAFGDSVLKYLADLLRQSVRQEDVIARVGGDEFLIFLEYTDQPEPLVARVFHALSESYGNFRLSISMGIACNESGNRDYDKLFHRADQALYAAKREGRNRYRFYDDSMRSILTGGGYKK